MCRQKGERRERGGNTTRAALCPAAFPGTTLDEALLPLVRQLLERLHLGLLNEESREDARQHPEGEDLEPTPVVVSTLSVMHRASAGYSQMVDELASAANVDQLAEADLRDDSAQLTRGSRDTVRGRAVASGERLTRDDEGRGVRPEVLEEVREAVEEDERLLAAARCGELVVGEAHDDEEDGEHDEAHELDGLAAPLVNHEERRPVPGDEARDGEDDVADADVAQGLVHKFRALEACGRRTEADRLQDDRGVQAKAVERNL